MADVVRILTHAVDEGGASVAKLTKAQKELQHLQDQTEELQRKIASQPAQMRKSSVAIDYSRSHNRRAVTPFVSSTFRDMKVLINFATIIVC